MLNAIDTRSDAYYYYYTYYHRLEYGAAVDGVEGGGPRGPRVPVGVGRSGGPVGPGGRVGPGDGDGTSGDRAGGGAGGGLGTRDRVLVPAAPPRGGLLRRINPFARDDDEPRGVRGGRIGRVRPDGDDRSDRDLRGGTFGGPGGGDDDLPPLEDPEGRG